MQNAAESFQTGLGSSYSIIWGTFDLLVFKVILGSFSALVGVVVVKFDFHLTPKSHWTGKGTKWILQILPVCFALRPSILSYRPFWGKCTKWPLNDLKQTLLHFTLWLAIFELQAILRTVHQMTPKWPWTLKGQKYPMYILQLPRVTDFTPFRSTASCSRVTGHFETSALNDSKMTLNTKRSKVPHKCCRPYIYYNYPWVPKFPSLHSRFQVPGHVKRSVPNDPQMTLNTKSSKVPHIYVT